MHSNQVQPRDQRKVLNRQSAQEFITPRVETREGDDAFQFYGYGVEMRTMLGHEVVSHAGNINGFNSMMFYFPNEKLSLCRSRTGKARPAWRSPRT